MGRRFSRRVGGASQGFTILELIIAVAIVGILASLVMPNLSSLILQAQMKSKADAIVAGLQLARAEAFKRNASVSVQFEPAASSNTSTGGFTIGCSSTVFNSGASASLQAFCPGSRFASAAVSYAPGSNAIYKRPPEDGSGGTLANAKYRIRFDQTQTIPTVTFDPFGNLAPSNGDGTLSIIKVLITPNTLTGQCKNVTNSKGTFSACEIDVVVSNSGGARVCYPSMLQANSAMGC